MLTNYYLLQIWEWSGARRLLAVMVSAAAAFLVTVGTSPLAQVPMAAGIAQIGLMQEEHSVMADYLRKMAEADRAAVLAEARERDGMRATNVLATATATAAATATAIPLPKPARPVRLAASAKTEAGIEPLSPPVAGPLKLQSANLPPRPQADQKQARGVLATVERLPRWAWAALQNAADWAIIGPVQTIARLPERRFL